VRVDQAKKLKYGQRVSCPPDRGSAGFTGTVRTENLDQAIVNNHPNGGDYIWVEVMGPTHKSVWPSNRLGFA
jgi:hypothetical protein